VLLRRGHNEDKFGSGSSRLQKRVECVTEKVLRNLSMNKDLAPARALVFFNPHDFSNVIDARVEAAYFSNQVTDSQ
jgi:hypothetical protein